MKPFLVILALFCAATVRAASPVPTHGNVQEFDSVVQLLTSSPTQLTKTYICKGLYTIGDGKAGKFYYVAGSSATTNATDVIAWSGGRLFRTVDGVTATQVFVNGGSTNYMDGLLVNGTFTEVGAIDFNGDVRTNWPSSDSNSVVRLGPFTPGRYPIATGTNTLGDGNISKSGDDTLFDIGLTNILTLTRNTASQQRANVASPDGSLILTLASDDSGTGTLITSGILTLSGNSTDILIQSGEMIPSGGGDGASVVNIGSYNNPFRDIWSQRTNYITGFQTDTNYSRGALYHTGTNGALFLASQSAGTAGVARPIILTNAAVQIATNANAMAMGWISASRFLLRPTSATTIDIQSSGGFQALRLFEAGNLTVGRNTQSPPGFGTIIHEGQMVNVPTDWVTTGTLPISVLSAIMRVSGNSGPLTLTNTPTLSLNLDGTTTVFMGSSDVNTVTIQDDGTLSGSKILLKPASTSFTLTTKKNITLVYTASDGFWHEIARTE